MLATVLLMTVILFMVAIYMYLRKTDFISRSEEGPNEKEKYSAQLKNYEPGSGFAGLNPSNERRKYTGKEMQRNRELYSKKYSIELTPVSKHDGLYSVDLFKALHNSSQFSDSKGKIFGFGAIEIQGGKHAVLNMNKYIMLDTPLSEDDVLPHGTGSVFPTAHLIHATIQLFVTADKKPSVEIQVYYSPNTYHEPDETESNQFIYDGKKYHVVNGKVVKV